MRRWYTKRAFTLMKSVRVFILVITSFLWVPLYVLVFVGMWIDSLLSYLDGALDKFLDKVIPQIK